ncbi:hypothetical protein EJ08DRAFT_199899 [Tothia fuscella]|uniref:BTB domain-containing protein n=1 Tax=Tothia fuscella TaxID=1048955 RepID=A0A9P4NS42_9PEZI|nr:hypothetical protein EJ08DRAFT_199899 [Tothia fuscella]
MTILPKRLRPQLRPTIFQLATSSVFQQKLQVVSHRTTRARVMASATPANRSNSTSSSMIRKPATEGPILGREVVEIWIVDDEKPFIVHRQLIASSSEFFNKALNGEFKEKEGVVRLAVVDNSANFDIYVRWLYSCQLYSQFPGDASTNEVTAKEANEEWPRLAALYIIGDVLLDQKFRNVVIDAILERVKVEDRFPTGLVDTVYSSTPAKSKLRKLLVDIWVCASEVDWFESGYDDLTLGPAEFWVEVAAELVKRRKDCIVLPWFTDRCQYHEHEDVSPACTPL